MHAPDNPRPDNTHCQKQWGPYFSAQEMENMNLVRYITRCLTDVGPVQRQNHFCLLPTTFSFRFVILNGDGHFIFFFRLSGRVLGNLKRMQNGMRWPFVMRVYGKKTKQCAIMFKPYNVQHPVDVSDYDKNNHFSIIWAKKWRNVPDDMFERFAAEIEMYLRSHTLSFRIIKACLNCTYGRFCNEFENMILQFRKECPELSTAKDLTFDDPKHQHLKDEELWTQDYPIWAHIHNRTGPNADFNSFMQGPRGSVLTLDFIFPS